MPAALLDFPKPLPGDPSSVASALDSGRRQWIQGELRDAVRWVHRAADAAESAGDDVRALGLARIAADLMSSLEASSVTSMSLRDEAAALAPFDDFNDQTLVDAPGLLAARQALESAVVIEERAARPESLLDTALSSELRAPAPAIRRRTAVRVAVGRIAARDGKLDVRVLADGASPPPGTDEALLVVVDADAALPVRFER